MTIVRKFGFLPVSLLVLFASELTAQQSPSSSTWIVVRHADRAGQQDALTEAGERRAQQLAELVKILRVDAIYSTDTRRTRETAAPTARSMDLPVQLYDDLSESWFCDLKEKHAGQAVLIVGHSNTVGPLVNGLGVVGDFSVSEDQYENLYIVTTAVDQSHAVQLKFGEQLRTESE